MPQELSTQQDPGFRHTMWLDDKTGKVLLVKDDTFATDGKYVYSSVTKPAQRSKPKGWLVPTAYERREVIVNNPRGNVRTVLKGSGSPSRTRRISGDLRSVNPSVFRMLHDTRFSFNSCVDVDMVSQAEAKALSRLLTHGKQLDGNFKAGVAWRERKELAGMLNNTARTMVDTMKALRAGRWRQAFGLVGERPSKGHPFFSTEYWKHISRTKSRSTEPAAAALASGFLSLQNGWKPFLADISNAAEALANRTASADWVITGIGKYDRLDRNSVYADFGTGYSSAPTGLLEWQVRRRVKVRIDATIADPVSHTLAQLGLNNPAHLVWESTRLTYLLDYILAVGKWLEALGAADGMKFHSGSWTVTSEYVSENSCAKGDGRWSGSARYFHTTRRVYSSFPVPIAPLSLKPEPLKLEQLLNALSVGYLAFRGQHVPYSKMG